MRSSTFQAFRAHLAFFGLLTCTAPAFAASPDAVRELLQSTSVDRMMRADAARTSEMLNEWSTELPPALRSELTKGFDRTLDAAAMDEELVKTAASRLKAADIESHLRWWASVSGREIAEAEAKAYESIMSGLPLDPAVPRPRPANEGSNDQGAQRALAEGQFSGYVEELFRTVERARLCLQLTMNLGPDCDSLTDVPKPAVATIQTRFARVPIGDLDAYRAYLRADGTKVVMETLRSSMIAVQEGRLSRAAADASKAIEKYARAHVDQPQEALRAMTVAVDTEEELEPARIALQFLRRAEPRNPEVLVQLARVTLKQSEGTRYSSIAGMPPSVNPADRKEAGYWLDKAHALDPKRLETLVLEGHLAWLNSQHEKGIALLEQAKAIGTNHPWLRINLGNALYARALETQDVPLARRAAQEFETALQEKLAGTPQDLAIETLGEVYAFVGDIEKADKYYRQYIALFRGEGCAFSDKYGASCALFRYAAFLLLKARNVDAAIATYRQAFRISRDPYAHGFFVQALLVKAGQLYAEKQPAEAAKLVAEAHGLAPNLEMLCADMARGPALFPGVRALHDSGAMKSFRGTQGGRCLVNASFNAKAADIDQMLAWGANPNYVDSDDGTALHMAIHARNVGVVKTLLAHGANPMTRAVDGRTPTELVEDDADPASVQIRSMLEKALSSRAPDAQSSRVVMRKGYLYRIKQPIDGERHGHFMKGGEELIFSHECQYSDSRVACFAFNQPGVPNVYLDLAVEKERLGSWTDWFEEIRRAP